jgi:hypothetical protein
LSYAVPAAFVTSGVLSRHLQAAVGQGSDVVVGGLQAELGTREAVGQFVRCYNDERRRLSLASADSRTAIADELAAVDRQIARAV